jgi:hypothetical protein
MTDANNTAAGVPPTTTTTATTAAGDQHPVPSALPTDVTMKVVEMLGQQFDMIKELVVQSNGVIREVKEALVDKKHGEHPIANQLERAEMAKYQPWRITLKAFELRQDAALARAASLRQSFLGRATMHTLTAEQVLQLTIPTYGDDNDRAAWSVHVLELSGQQLLLQHNWWVARKLGESFMLQHGGIIEALTYPLFPPTNEFVALNDTLLSSCYETVTGGGARRRNAVAEGLYSRKATGGYAPLPIVADPAFPGGCATDAQAVADAQGEMRNQITLLRARLETLERGNRGGGGAWPTPTPRGGRGDGRGRGGGAKRGARGGGDADGAEDFSQAH